MASPVSSDEGEIRDTGIEKATTSLLELDGAGVDPQDRNRSRSTHSKSPPIENGSSLRDTRPADRSHSSYSDRNSRGSKRSREEDHYDRRHTDPRRFKVHYEDRSADYRRRGRVSYEDLDNGSTPSPDLRYDDRDRYPDKRPRTRSRSRSRSRSPYRAPVGKDRRERGGPIQKDRNRRDGYPQSGRSPSYGFEGQKSRSLIDQSVSKRGDGPVPADVSKQEAKSAKGSSQQRNDISSNGVGLENSGPTSGDTAEIPAESEPLDEAALIEQRRKRREAIKAKYGRSGTPMLVQALHIEDKSAPGTPGRTQLGEEDNQSTRSASPALSTPATPVDTQDSPPEFAITNDEDLANKNGDMAGAAEEDGPSAADYDPTVDMREDQRRDDQRHHDDVPSSAYEESQPTLDQDVLLPEPAAPAKEKVKKSKDDFDMFAEGDDDDMFAEESPIQIRAEDNVATNQESSIVVPIPQGKELDISMLDNWDDPEGYYKIILGELLNGRYHVQTKLGRGMFSDVVRATDATTKKTVAIKVIRNNDTMRKAGLKEVEIIQKLNEADPDDKKHLIRLERSFEHKGHLCMVFENLSINLREVLKKFGRDRGIDNLKAIRAYAQQMFLGLSLMRKCNVLHADLKPDNILVNESPHNLLKICDLGSASDATENEITPYLVSRFYRAPEIILGMSYDFAIDIWSIGCTLYELFTGKILFTGRTNNNMLRSIMECRGKFTTKMLRRAQFAHMHFDEMANFRSVEQDKLTGKDTVKIINFAKPTRDLRTRLLSASKGKPDVEMKELNLFIDLLDRCLVLDPVKRVSPYEALKHPFISRVPAK